mmetsp:Transcript_99906/g.308242  ORF Transcript_99906/g.308242 Transcript_99906/m.308242 type:complete len:205 (-) Transcript_99906:219-833(-)
MQVTRPLSASKMSCAEPSFVANSESSCGALFSARARPSPPGRSASCRAKLPKTRKARGVAGPMAATTPFCQKTPSTSFSTPALVSTSRSGSTHSASTRASCRAATCTCSWSRRLWRTRCTTWSSSSGVPMALLRWSRDRTFCRSFEGTVALGSTLSEPAASSRPGGAEVSTPQMRRPTRAASPARSSSGSSRLQLLSARLHTAS